VHPKNTKNNSKTTTVKETEGNTFTGDHVLPTEIRLVS